MKFHVIKFCFSSAFQVSGPDEVRCAFCFETTGRIIREHGSTKVDFKEITEEEARMGSAQHRETWIAPTGGWFQKHRAEIMALRAEFADVGMPWLQPPQTD